MVCKALRVLASATVIISSVAQGSICDQLKAGSYPTTVGLAAVAAAAKKSVVSKDEFESSAAYQARVAGSAPNPALQEFATEWPLEQYLFKYDADTQRVSYGNYAFKTTCLTFDSALSEAARAVTFIRRDASYLTPYCLTRTTSWKSGGSYVGSNTYGATAKVDRGLASQVGLYLGMGVLGLDIWTGDKEDTYAFRSPAFETAATPDAARSLKDRAVAVVVFRPKPPFYAKGSYYIGATLDRPTSISSSTDFVVGSIECVALADPKTRTIFQVRPTPHN